MKTLDEVIAEMEGMEFIGTLADALYYLKGFKRISAKLEKIALGNITETLEKLDNPALTWEELRQMKGKPVWVVPEEEKGYWLVIEFFNNNPYYGGDRVCFTNDVMLNRCDLGTKWQAYRKERS